jgi:hypothetical protein
LIKKKGADRHPLSSSSCLHFPGRSIVVVVIPNRGAEIDIIAIGNPADSTADDTADNRSGSGIAASKGAADRTGRSSNSRS